MLAKIKEKYLFILIAVSFSMLTVYAHDKSGVLTSEKIIPFYDRLAHMVLMYEQYLKQFIFPFNLSVFYPYEINYGLWQLFVAILLFLSVTIFGLKLANKSPYILFGWLWFVVMILPVTGLVQTGGHGHADRYMYFPVIGLLIAVIFLIENIYKKIMVGPTIARFSAITFIVMVSIVTAVTTLPWKNTYTLFFNALENTENNFVAHRNLATAFLNDGIVTEGILHYEKARSIRPNFLSLYDGVSHKLVAIQEYDLAVKVLHDGIQSGISGGETFRKIGQIELLNDNYNLAIENFTKANIISPDLKGVRYGLAFAYYSLDNYNHALNNILLELDLDPQNEYARRLYADICKKIPTTKPCSR